MVVGGVLHEVAHTDLLQFVLICGPCLYLQVSARVEEVDEVGLKTEATNGDPSDGLVLDLAQVRVLIVVTGELDVDDNGEHKLGQEDRQVGQLGPKRRAGALLVGPRHPENNLEGINLHA